MRRLALVLALFCASLVPIAAEAAMPLDQYSYDTHLAAEDAELFAHEDASRLTDHRRARHDLVRDLLGLGIEADDVLDRFEVATVTLRFTATATGELTVPAGTVVRDLDPASRVNGAVRFVTDEQLVVSAGQTGDVLATAADPGEPGNVSTGQLLYLEAAPPANFSAVTNPAAAAGGVDHELTRAAVYRALELAYTDLLRKEGDAFDFRRGLCAKLYKAELERMTAAGLETAKLLIEDLVVGDVGRDHGTTRLERG